MRKQLLSIILLVFLAIAGLWLSGQQQQATLPAPGEIVQRENSAPAAQTSGADEVGVMVDKKAPGFTLTGLEGKSVEAVVKGQVTILNFWATWCPPCRAEMPELDRFARKHQGVLRFYAVNIKESGDTVKAFLRQNQYQLPVLLDSDGKVAETYAVWAIPTTLILDANGVIRYRKAGAVTLQELEKVIADL
ncbi:TlpA family protein disulfide reductase [Acetonema longum]|uniref:Alkyl hydroperoxide reductase/ Thiol specific antioxidant/ Mal allergen n=1 Tax=Acetonema longum DSM 6540 TaxID=1009370 RepID=F7NNJ6_9FIRM|nr:TlpA disulfide reductase family protein [Acetonema longum]EGO62437.1 alkyl hydroperoxide reductase/ Thiol specific antioxidant/ Mal allergen [Acetonema longum DSM 6540]